MTESTRKKVVFGLLGAAIIYGATSIEWSTPQPSSPPPQAQASPSIMGDADRANPMDTHQPEPGMMTDPGSSPEAAPLKASHMALMACIDSILATPWGDDPFQFNRRHVRAKDQVEETVGWKVSGIVFTPSNPMAVINSQPVKVGDVVNDAAVVKIEQNRVTLECRGDRFVIAVNEG